MPLDEYLSKIKPYLTNIIIDLQNSDTWKNLLTILINFISLKNAKEVHLMHSRNNNKKFTSYSVSNEGVEELFESLRSKYQENLETSMTGSDYIFDSFQLMYYKCQKVNFTRSGSYIDSSK